MKAILTSTESELNNLSKRSSFQDILAEDIAVKDERYDVEDEDKNDQKSPMKNLMKLKLNTPLSRVEKLKKISHKNSDINPVPKIRVNKPKKLSLGNVQNNTTSDNERKRKGFMANKSLTKIFEKKEEDKNSSKPDLPLPLDDSIKNSISRSLIM